MSGIADKVKEKLKGTKEKVTDTSTKAGVSADDLSMLNRSMPFPFGMMSQYSIGLPIPNDALTSA